MFEQLCPTGSSVDWPSIRDAFWWIRRMTGVPQDAVHHAEGDVETHTRMACEALVSLPEWQALPRPSQVRMFATVLLHDVAKPDCTQHVEGRITAHGHSRRGDLLVRRILWELGASASWREHVAALVRHHQVPFWALERPDIEQIAFRVSLLASNADLAMLATADILGRICTDVDQVVENIALYREYCAELSCLDGPRVFPSDHARFMYFRTPGRDPNYAAYDDTRMTVTVMSGLPGVGKDTWISSHRPDLPVISLDTLRAELRVKPTDNQRPVISAAQEQARRYLRAGESFVWNGTNVSRQIRQQSIGLAAAYKARVEVVALEAPLAVITSRNAARPEPVPAAVIDRLANKWEAPDPTEGHSVQWLSTE
ncbi:AAA family ATPase [Kibdelosporangium philippinense]|uniref:AAA family ATPase n=1 Tax=Kibdelosporangium philippinense TaxID=211113 RepID=A0ABS8Z869_9PSEU|nr:AAA family ATPase [Kibdelosporangium philippinense]MCE7004084.1 AAA family ATPase [Kibdelosporangium philippinense]